MNKIWNQYTKNTNRNMFKGSFILMKILKHNVYYPERYLLIYSLPKKAFIIWFCYLNIAHTHIHIHRLKKKDWEGVHKRLTVVIFGGKIFSLFFITVSIVQSFLNNVHILILSEDKSKIKFLFLARTIILKLLLH